MLPSIASGLSSSFFLLNTSHNQNQSEQDKTPNFTLFFKCLHSYFQLTTTFLFVNKARHAVLLPPVHSGILQAAYVTSVITHLARHKWLTPNTPAYEMSVSFQAYTDKICQIAALTSSIALIYLGNPLFGAASVFVFAAEILNHQKWIAQENIFNLKKFTFFLSNFSSLTSGNPYARVFSMIRLADYFTLVYFPLRKENEPPAKGILTTEKLNNILKNNTLLQLKRRHVYYPTAPQSPSPCLFLKILTILQQKRANIAKKILDDLYLEEKCPFFLAAALTNTEITDLTDSNQDKEDYTKLKNLIKIQCGLKNEEPNIHYLTYAPFLFRPFIPKQIDEFLSENFWNLYKEKSIVQTISKSIEKDLFIDWWKQWIAQLPIWESNKKQNLSKELISQRPTLNGVNLFADQEQPNPLFIKAMLLEMGILEEV